MRLSIVAVVILTGLVMLSSTTDAIGQASQRFDLACRGLLVAGGDVSVEAPFGVIGALGVAIAPIKNSNTAPTYAVRSNRFGVRAGFLPGYPTDNDATAERTTEQLTPEQGEPSRLQRLPIIAKALFIVRGGC